jgi:uncharacterized membrane protein YhfC
MMEKENWRISKQVNVSVLLQLIFLASLIVGSWVNLQRQLDLLCKDVGLLVENNRQFQQKLEKLTEEAIAHEYRLQAIESFVAKENN